MKKTLTLLCAGVLLAAPAWAKPVAVTLYPGGAVIKEELQLTPNAEGMVEFNLTPEADPQTLNLAVSGAEVSSQLLAVAEAARSPEYEKLKKERDQVRNDIAQKQAAIRGLAFQQSVMHTLRVDSPEKLQQAEQHVLETVTASETEANRLKNDVIDLEIRKKVLEQRLKDMAGMNATTNRVTLQLAYAKGPVTVSYSYNTQGAGWRPLYKVEALPGKSEIVLNLEAELWQNSGENWMNVPISLVTINPTLNSAPPSLSDWIIQPRRPIMARAAMNMENIQPMQEEFDSKVFAMAPAAPAPQYAEGASFAAWDLGRRDLPAGPMLRLPLDAMTIAARFDYTVRPSRSDYAYLAARLARPANKHLPAGEALLLVDGVVTGSTRLALEAEAEPRLFFGRDPLVFATMKQNRQQSGQEGIISKAQTYVWDWSISVTNQHQMPINVRVEEPLPQSRAEQINVQITSKPEAKTEEQTLVWNVPVKAGETSIIQHKVSFSAPTDMNIEPGR